MREIGMKVMTMHCLKLVFLVGLVLLALSPPASAQPRAGQGDSAAVCAAGGVDAPSPILLAQGWSLGRWFSGAGGRTRVVQFCVVTMCVALFIMMRKLN
jgi:hypothetical protein